MNKVSMNKKLCNSQSGCKGLYSMCSRINLFLGKLVVIE